MYRTQKFTASIAVESYARDYVNIEEFLECCKACENYGRIWSCPPYSFDVMDFWNQYKNLNLTAVKIIFDEELREQEYELQEIDKILEKTLFKEKEALTQELWAKEEKRPGSISLSAGSCQLCGKGNCAKESGSPCRHADKMRYSLESLGGNVGLTVSRLFGIELKWMEEGRLPEYFVLVCGLLY